MNKPNVLIFMTDHQRGDSVLGRARMPYTDRLRSQGVTFSETFCPSPHCCPSRATFFTGLYPSRHGVWHNVDVANAISRGFNSGVRTWSEDLAEAGYRMWFSGKWHVSHHESPADRGWKCCPSTPDDYANRPVGDAWTTYRKLAGKQTSVERDSGQIQMPGYPDYRIFSTVDEETHPDTLVVDEAVDKMEKLADENSEQPWCLFVGCSGPHDPYDVPQKYLDMYNPDAIKLPPNFYDTMTDKPNFYRRTRDIFARLSEAEHRRAMHHYLAYCSFEDALLGRLLNTLEESGQAGDTVVIALSDHGDYMAEHGLWTKGVPCFRGAYHVPLIIRWPAGIRQPGRVVDTMVSLADLAPTILETAQLHVDREFGGKSLSHFLRDEKTPDWRDMIFTQTNGNELYAIQRAGFNRQYKMVYNGFDYDEFYDLAQDPLEMNNLINATEYQETIKQMMKRIWRFAEENHDTCINPYIMVRFASYGPGAAFE